MRTLSVDTIARSRAPCRSTQRAASLAINVVLPTPVGPTNATTPPVLHPALADRLDATSDQCEREAMRFGQLHSLRQLAHQLAGEIVRETEHVN